MKLLCLKDRIGMDKIQCWKKICYEKVTMNPIHIKEISENYIEMSYEIDVKSNSCYKCDDNNIICLIKQKSSLMIEDEILN